jgi:hypothetical protein
MGGQACVFYGAAEFSRDVDLAILCEPDNLDRLQKALDELQARCVAVPPFERSFLERGHAIHFRCQHPDADNLRIDVMSVMRGVSPFIDLWERRTVITGEDGVEVDLLALPDLVLAKKTQRDKDWPMIRRLVEANYFQFHNEANPARIEFWLRELRSPELLLAVARTFPDQAAAIGKVRPLVGHAIDRRLSELEAALTAEELDERVVDRAYWKPLRIELERLRHKESGAS